MGINAIEFNGPDCRVNRAVYAKDAESDLQEVYLVYFFKPLMLQHGMGAAVCLA